MGYWNSYPPYVSVAEKKAKAAKKLAKLQKKNPDIQPILIEGRTIAKSWWGKSWNRNLEQYADYSNRIGRGRSYVRHGAVLDLSVESGKVESLVQGSRSKPYSVNIKIKALKKKTWQDIQLFCKGKLDSIQELLSGRFPKDLDDIFMAREKGLFPSPKEIAFSCSCPDWAYMCKHVAATLYGIGARLDDDPSLFFILRKVEMKDLITRTVDNETQKLLQKAKIKADRIIPESNLGDIFGIEMEETVAPVKRKARATKKASKKKKKSPGVLSGKPVSQTSLKKKSGNGKSKSHYDTVVGIIRRSRKGVNVARIREKTGLDDTKIRNLIYKAKRQGKVKNLRRGIYIKA